MWIEAGDGDAWLFDAPASKKIVEERTDADDLLSFKRVRDFAKRNMDGDQGDRKFSASQKHREVFRPATLGEKFGLTGKLEADLVHSRLVNGPGDDSVEFAVQSEVGRFLKGRERGRGSFCRRLA